MQSASHPHSDFMVFTGNANPGLAAEIARHLGITLAPARVAVVKPQQGLATRLIFCDPQLQRSTQPAILAGFAADPWDFGHNDLQPVAQRLCPGVDQALSWLAAQGLSARMTGSGSAVFARLPEGVSPSCPPEGMQLQVCSTLDAHPLVGWAPSDDSSVGG